MSIYSSIVGPMVLDVHVVRMKNTGYCREVSMSVLIVDIKYLYNSWYDISRHKKAANAMVSCYMACYKPEIWSKCVRTTTHLGFWKLSNSVDMVTQASEGYGATGTRSPFRYSGD